MIQSLQLVRHCASPIRYETSIEFIIIVIIVRVSAVLNRTVVDSD